MHDYIKASVRAVLEITREIEEWREDYAPSAQEWYTLLNLAETADRLVFALPVEMLPEEELRTPSPREYEVLDELLSTIAELGEAS
ncbi:hypothetical protein AB0G73_10765 [Streptomyces sp. NPDC020719]|uniref:hypothetical protein n=1 Tax=Streptomyces sp. NPDC020719 TaxID=3154896 RepID=UPI0033F0DECC